MQKKALIILRLIADIEKNKSDVSAIKHALISARRADPIDLFPEIFGEEKKDITEVTDEEEDADVTYDYSGVTWNSGSDAYDEYQRLMDQIGATKNGTVTGDMLSGQGEPTWTDWS